MLRARAARIPDPMTLLMVAQDSARYPILRSGDAARESSAARRALPRGARRQGSRQPSSVTVGTRHGGKRSG